MNGILTVSELTRQIKVTLEEGFSTFSLVGEISGFKAHNSGHWYFNLKDNNAVICCTMWKGNNNFVFFTPQDGMKVIVTGRLSVYPPRGNYQVDVRSMKPAGIGELQAAFEILKQKLSAEGLFDSSFKKPIPRCPQKIGIITAIDGAALKDMISIAERRFPLVELVIAPARVQGTGAAESIVKNLKLLNNSEVDVIIVARGGGSIEDLWAFNEEAVARAVFDSEIPVISGVGHEIDFTICDFVSDLRAPTPSAAMEIAVPCIEDFLSFINEFTYSSTRAVKEKCRASGLLVKTILSSYGFRQPLDIVRKNFQDIDNISYRMENSIDKKIMQLKNQLDLLSGVVKSHDITSTLKKGFVLLKQDSATVSKASDFKFNTGSQLVFADGKVEFVPFQPENTGNTDAEQVIKENR